MIALVSTFKNDIILLYSVFGNSPAIKKIRTFEDMGQFSHDMLEVTKAGGVDSGLSENIGRIIYRKLDKSTLPSLVSQWERKDIAGTMAMLESAIKTGLKAKNVKVQADADKISSLKFRIKNVINGIISPINRPEDDPEPAGNPDELNVPIKASESETEIAQIIQQFPQVVICKTVLSPVAGIEFDQLQENQKILFSLPFQTEEEKNLASSLGAVDKEGINRPIPGEFYRIVTGQKNEFHIFAKGPNGVMLRAFEERPVRLAVPKDKTKSAEQKKTKPPAAESKSYLGYIVIGVMGILVLILVASFLF